ncbi:MAG: heme-binding domain-containing protein [Bacteroidota bacterium]|nr:heme-binding domain-containing protein [Bacteroidota bacterium]
MSRVKKILLVTLVVIVAIQFIQPARNKSGQVLPTDISKVYSMPGQVQSLLKNACYDCHSNNTNYPWYATIQPVGWMLARHIKNGKVELNYNEFGVYSIRKQRSKLNSIAKTIEDGTMPLSTYTLIHKNAILTKEEKALIIDWANATKDSLSLKN